MTLSEPSKRQGEKSAVLKPNQLYTDACASLTESQLPLAPV